MADADSMQGAWQLVSATVGGEDDPNEEVGRTTFEFRGDTVVIGDEAAAFEHDVELNERLSPREITIRSRSGAYPFQQYGIYELKGDVLTICYSPVGVTERPRDFASVQDSEIGLFVLSRITKAL